MVKLDFKLSIFYLFLLQVIFSCTSNNILNQEFPETNRREKEGKEIEYLIDCIKVGRKPQNLIKFNLFDYRENAISFNYKKWSWVADFIISGDSTKPFLQSIEHKHERFHKTIFRNESKSEFQIDEKTQFQVWMSKDRHSIYYFMIQKNEIFIWILTNGNWVYSRTSKL